MFMYKLFSEICERFLRIPHDPTPPPGHEASATRIFRAAPNFYRYLLVIWCLKTLGTVLIFCLPLSVPLIIGAITLSSKGKPWGWLLLLIPALILVLVLVLRLFALAIVRLDFEKRWYLITDRSLRIREGVVSINEMTVNFLNVQNLSISQGPIQRILGIADLQVETAGGGSSAHEQNTVQSLHVARFRGLDTAQEVRELIQARLRNFKDAGLGDPEDATGAVSDRGELTGPKVRVGLNQVLQEAAALRRALEEHG
jgi:uncharacterized membrane protein YdbT with pleckstrin-like domain